MQNSLEDIFSYWQYSSGILPRYICLLQFKTQQNIFLKTVEIVINTFLILANWTISFDSCTIQYKIWPYINFITIVHKFLNTMSKQKLSQLFILPFLQSYHTGTRKFITIGKVHNFLGYNFYSRLNSIYENLIEAFAKKNYRYLQTSFETSLLLKYMKDMKFIEDGRYKIRVHYSDTRFSIKKMANKNKMKKLLPMRDTVWEDGVTKIGLQCNVYFGEKFNRQDPMKLLQNLEVSKLYRVGQFRYVRYYRQLSLWQNIKNMYKEQTYELLVKYSSKLYLQIQNYDQITKNQSQLLNPKQQQSKQIMTEVIMRTGNEKFDWLIVDINDANKQLRVKSRNNISNNISLGSAHQENIVKNGQQQIDKQKVSSDTGKQENK